MPAKVKESTEGRATPSLRIGAPGRRAVADRSSGSGAAQPRARFRDLCFDTREGSLWRDGTRIALTPTGARLLALLISRAGRLVEKQEILDHVWNGTAVSQAVIKVCVRELRRALDDSARAPVFIQTEHRRGYRFLAEVEIEEETPNIGDSADEALLDLARMVSGLGGDKEGILEKLIREAQRAQEANEYADCLDSLNAALNSAEFLLPHDRLLRYELLLRAGEAGGMAERISEARDALSEAIQIARELADRERFARAVLALGRCFQSGLTVAHTLVELLEESIGMFDDPQDPLRVLCEARLHLACLATDRAVPEARVLGAALSSSMRTAEQIGVLHCRLAGDWRAENQQERWAISLQMLSLADRTRSLDRRLGAYHAGLFCALEAGDGVEFRRRLDTYLQLSESSSNVFRSWKTESVRIMHATMLGDFDAAERQIQDAMKRARTLEWPDVLAVGFVQLMVLRNLQGRVAEIAPFLENYVRDHPDQLAYRAALAHTRAVIGDHRGLRSFLSTLASDALSKPSPKLVWLAVMTTLADACAIVGDRRIARSLYDALAPFERLCAVVLGASYGGSIQRPMGRLAAVLRRREAARRHFELAIAVNGRFGAKAQIDLCQRQRDQAT